MQSPQNHDRCLRSRLIFTAVFAGCAVCVPPGTPRALAAVLFPEPGGQALSAPQSGTQVSIDNYIRELESSYRDVRTLRAEFTQTYKGDGRTRVESGTVYLARDGLMRWDYREPEEKLFLSDGKHLMLYIPSERQLARSSVRSSEDVRVPFSLLLSRLNMRKVFSRIEFADQALNHSPADRVLRAFPKPGSEDYRDVLIELAPTFDIRRLVVSHLDGSVMEFGFDRLARNVVVGAALFHFNPPPGTEVIDQR
jgi:outer membrane lipoprotein carrier protein